MNALQAVIYRAPMSNRIAGWFGLGLVTMVWIAFGALFGIVTRQPQFANSSRYGVSFVNVTYYGTYIILAYCILRSHRSRLILSNEDVSIGNAILQRRIGYDNVRVIELEDPQRRKSRTRRLHIQLLRGRGAFMDLFTADAEECFHALRELCPNVPAIGPGATIYSTTDPTYEAAGRATLAAEYQGKSTRAFVGAITCAVLAIGAVSALVIVPGARLHPKFWLGAVILPIVAIALLRASRVFRHNAVHMEGIIDQPVDGTD